MENENLGGAENSSVGEGERKIIDNKSLVVGLCIFLVGIGIGILAKKYTANIGWVIGAEDYKENQLKSDFDFFALDEKTINLKD